MAACFLSQVSPCNCNSSGYCKRHRMQKGPKLFKLCQTSAAYRRLFDKTTETRGKKTKPLSPEKIERIRYKNKLMQIWKKAGKVKRKGKELDQLLAICSACDLNIASCKERRICGYDFLPIRLKCEMSTTTCIKWTTPASQIQEEIE